jgi:hypothetical protein
VVARVICPRDGQVSSGGDISYDHSLFSDIAAEPVDFQGLDSQFSRALVKTIPTDTPDHYVRLFLLL